MLSDGPEPLGLIDPAVQSGSGPVAGRLAAGDFADTSVLFSGSRVLVGTQTARERVRGERQGLGSPQHLSDSNRPPGTFSGQVKQNQIILAVITAFVCVCNII